MFKQYKFVKDIDGYQGQYKITANGKVWSVKRKRFLTPIYDKDGYQTITLYKDGFSKTYKIHRLVAIAFIPNEEELATVNHKNHIRHDNRVSNLEWLSFADNIRDSHNIGVCQLDDDDNIIAMYNSITDASKDTGIYRTGISRAINGMQPKVSGKKFKRREKDDMIAITGYLGGIED